MQSENARIQELSFTGLYASLQPPPDQQPYDQDCLDWCRGQCEGAGAGWKSCYWDCIREHCVDIPSPPHTVACRFMSTDCDDLAIDGYSVAEDECLTYACECGFPPCVDPVDCSLTSSEVAEADEIVSFGEVGFLGGWTDEEKSMMIRAIAVLRKNIDLVKWVCCVIFGPASDVCECMADFLSGSSRNINFRVATEHNVWT